MREDHVFRAAIQAMRDNDYEPEMMESALDAFLEHHVPFHKTTVNEMAMLIRRLVREVHHYSPDNAMTVRAMKYLWDRDLGGSPLRAEDTR